MAVDLVGVEHVVEGVEQRPQIGVDLRHDVAGEEPEPLAGLDRGPRQHEPAHLAARQRGDRHRYREERLAGPSRADPDRDRVVADRVDVALLVDGLRRHPQPAVAPDDVVEDAARALVAVERAADRLDRAGRDLMTLAHEVRDLAHDGLGGGDIGVTAVEREHVAAQVDGAVEVVLERLHDRVVGAAKLGCHLLGELQLRSH